MQKRSENKISKLATIKGILNGTLSFKDLMPQQIYFVTIKGKGDVYEMNRKEMSKDEYDKWKIANFRKDIDVLFLMDLSEKDNEINEPLKEYKPQEPKKQTQEPVTQEPVFEFPVLEPIKQAIKQEKEPEVKKIETKKIVEPEPLKRTFGKLSEYGIVWECQLN